MTEQPVDHGAGNGATGTRAVAAAPRRREADVAIIGAGLSGSVAAAVLERAGYRVALIDPYESYPPEFRVEKIGGDQVTLLARLDLLDAIAAVATRFDRVLNARHGRVVDRTYTPHYGIFYHDLVNVICAQLGTVDRVLGQAVDVVIGPDGPRVLLADQRSIDARLVIVATGMAAMLRHKLGLARRTICEKHSISFGFNVVPGRSDMHGFPALTYYGERVSDGIDYLSLFPIGGVMRANLFTFRDHRDPWVRDLRRQPAATLALALPGLTRFLGDFQVSGKVQNWTMDLYAMDNHLRDGIVLIGDAFGTSCPAAGTGVTRLLTDVHQLCKVHLPGWLRAGDRIGIAQIAHYYADRAKQSTDGRSLQLAHYRRSLTIDDTFRWKARREQAYLRRRMLGWVKELRLMRASMNAARDATGRHHPSPAGGGWPSAARPGGGVRNAAAIAVEPPSPHPAAFGGHPPLSGEG